MGTKSNDFRRLLQSCRQQSSSERFFVILNDLQRNLSTDIISGMLDEFEHSKHQHSSFVFTIFNRKLKVFAILT